SLPVMHHGKHHLQYVLSHDQNDMFLQSPSAPPPMRSYALTGLFLACPPFSLLDKSILGMVSVIYSPNLAFHSSTKSQAISEIKELTLNPRSFAMALSSSDSECTSLIEIRLYTFHRLLL
ncbi:MAG: hypothetical protein MR935_04030, partial [Agathobaculum sp.]|uniref:hypothetical protein n=1 Tax=Agathobaculum sp. TaxID=2048138 RepID=UPI0025C2B16C